MTDSLLDTARWKRLSEHLDELLSQPQDQREAALLALGLLAADRQTLSAMLASAETTATIDQFQLVNPEDIAPDVGPIGSAGERIGAWQLCECVGRGGMGEVWHARRADEAFDLDVALKLSARSHSHAGKREFEREIQRLATLDHPHIARLIDGGAAADKQFLVMEWIEGQTFDEACRAATLGQRVAWLQQLVAAINSAHRAFIIHCDLKPSNVLVDTQAQVKVIDFGIARELQQAADRSATVRYSPVWAAPEQQTGDGVGVTTDVFQIGLLIAHAVAPATDVRDLRAQLRDPAMASNNPNLPRDLLEIAAKAAADNPEDRYGQVSDIASDLLAYTQHKPISPRVDSWRYRLGLGLRRHWLPAALGSMAAVAILISLIVLSLQNQRLVASEAQATQQAEHAAETVQFLQLLFSEANPAATQAGGQTVLALLDEGVRQLEGRFVDEPATLGRLQTVLGRGLLANGDIQGGRETLQAAVASLAAAAPSDLAHLDAMAALGAAAMVQGDGETAQPLLAASFAQAKAQPPSIASGDIAAKAALRLAQLAFERDDIDTMRQWISAAEQVLQPLPDAPVLRYHRENVVYNRSLVADDPNRARSLLQQVYDLRRQRLGADHQATLEALAAKGALGVEAGLLGPALGELATVIAGQAARLGEAHQDLAVPYANLGNVELLLGRFAEGFAHLGRARDINQGLRPAEHILSITFERNWQLARLLAAERFEPAWASEFAALTRRAQEALGTDHIVTTLMRFDAGIFDLAAGDTAAALARLPATLPEALAVYPAASRWQAGYQNWRALAQANSQTCGAATQAARASLEAANLTQTWMYARHTGEPTTGPAWLGRHYCESSAMIDS